jgi:hypothetical protein
LAARTLHRKHQARASRTHPCSDFHRVKLGLPTATVATTVATATTATAAVATTATAAATAAATTATTAAAFAAEAAATAAAATAEAAATAAAAAAEATATAAAATAEAAATATTTKPTLFARPCDVDVHGTPIDLRAIHFRYCAFGFSFARQLDEAKPTRTSAHLINDNRSGDYVTKPTESFLKRRVGD